MSGSDGSEEFLRRTSPEAACCGGELHCPSETSGEQAKASALSQEGCPPPLQWQHVLTAFREQSETWQFDTAAGLVSGRSWGAGPTLVFFNGLGGSCELFGLCVYLLKPQCRCVVLDYPTSRGLSWSRLSDSMADIVLKFAGGEGCFLFGTSVGAALALEVALRAGSSVRGLVLHTPFAHLPLTVFERLAAKLLRWLPGRAKSIPLWRSLQERSHRLWFPPIDPTRWLFYLENAGDTPISAAAQRFGLLAQCDLRDRAAQVRAPVLLLQVEGEGEMQARCREELAALLPNGRTEFLHTTGLLMHLTHPHRLAKLIREFIAGTLSAPDEVDEAITGAVPSANAR